MGNIYGDWLKAQREAAGLTQQQLADAAIMTRSHISHIEGGRRVPSKEDARRLDMALGTGDVLSSFLPHGDVPVNEYFKPVLALERQATRIWEFASSFVPGLLQTESYARALFSSRFPPWSEEERDTNLVTRMERKKVLADPATPALWVVLDEGILRRPVGGGHVMREQIDHMADLAETGRVRVHVLPFGRPPCQLMSGTLILMWFEDQPPLAYSEGTAWGKCIDSPSVVTHLQAVFALALSDALPLQESIAHLRAASKDY
ncbi:helix-turn-helix transcriptional regulator [Streptomyces sp. NPDC097619]|uniref:helix-turn-helix domain-containing protein n=1 Tax=Streptomyces sp. NPDC097619 TaxID=3157228 RepID=UPI003327063D